MGLFKKIINKLIEEKRIDEELLIIDEAIKSNPQNPIGWRIKGGILFQFRRYEESIEAHNEVIKLNPNRADAWIFKGLAFYQLKRYDEALQMFEEGLRLDPQNNEILTLREHILSLKKT